jgi:anti-sigma regulatory factor (Ser/Thr protein kinase)
MTVLMTPREERSLSLSPELASVPASRRFVRGVLASWGLSGLTDDAELLVSELASNAVVHGATPFVVTVSWRVLPDRIRVSVKDESTATPQLRDVDVRATAGRGMQIVSDLAQASGVVPTAGGKDVWFELTADPTPAA